MPAAPTQVRLAKYVEGVPGDDAWAITHDAPPEPADGEVEIDVRFVSVDPGMKGWSTPIRSYIPPVEPGQVMRAFGIGPVVRSASRHFAEGDIVTGFTGVQSRAVVRQGWLRPVDVDVAPPELHLSVLGMTGFTGYFGMLDIGRPEPGQTVVVSAASGAVGSVAAQIAKREGARVIGIAGGPEKCAHLTEELGLDGAIDYKAGPVADRLRSEAPDGIDVYFDNVGGEILDAVLMRINHGARIVVCGGISQYGDMADASGPGNYLQLISKSGTMQGFTMMDYMHRVPEAFADLSAWVADGSLRHRRHIVDGLESFPEAFRMLFRGDNVGKLLLRVEGGDHDA
jgi:NADPH-dependent curcumin reductase CurA